MLQFTELQFFEEKKRSRKKIRIKSLLYINVLEADRLFAEHEQDTMSCCGFDPPVRRFFPVGGIFPLELTWVLTPFPKKFLDESINQGLVCAHMHSIAWTQRS